MWGTNETFVDGWNYCPSNNGFIDVAAPGNGIEILNGTSYSPNGRGTSDSAPFVSALCGLVLSINPSLSPNQVYVIITNSAEKIGQYPYDGNGWNKYMGYGRINAYEALKYTIEHYGGNLKQSFTIPAGETWTIDPGVTINLASGVNLTVNGSIISYSNLIIPSGSTLTVNSGANLSFASAQVFQLMVD